MSPVGRGKTADDVVLAGAVKYDLQSTYGTVLGIASIDASRPGLPGRLALFMVGVSRLEASVASAPDTVDYTPVDAVERVK